jgi:hypothetical protein
MGPELTDKQRQALEEQPGRPVEVVDPATQRAYVLLAREEYERLRSLLPGVPGSTPQPPEEAGLIPAGIRRSQEALRRALPQLLAQRKLRGQWVCYAGDEWVGIAPTKAALVRACLQRGLDYDAFYVGKIDAYELVEEEELDPPPPFLMAGEEGSHP